MENKLFAYYKTIGNIHSIISKANTVHEAIQESLKVIIQSCHADYAVCWYKDKEETLHPYYWICPIDFTKKKHIKGKGLVSKVYETGNSVRLLDYQKNSDKEVEDDFTGLGVTSFVCSALSNQYETIGCVEVVKVKGQFDEETADIIEMMTTLVAMEIDDNEKFNNEFKERKVILSAKEIVREFKNGDILSKVLKGVNLDVYEGEFVVLLGESGCGKSTFLNIISGMDKATSGTFEFMGKDMSNASQEELTIYRRDNIGFIFQSYNLMPNLNIQQNLDLIGELVSDPKDSAELLGLVGLGEKLHSYPSQLSGGQQQRVSIARALVKKPCMIMADEPTAALDYETSIEVLSALENVKNKGTTMIMVTHNEEICKMADRVVRMRNGQVFETVINRHPCKASDLVW